MRAKPEYICKNQCLNLSVIISSKPEDLLHNISQSDEGDISKHSERGIRTFKNVLSWD